MLVPAAPILRWLPAGPPILCPAPPWAHAVGTRGMPTLPGREFDASPTDT
ncbi:hypothetical protein F751_3227 [Auxenochlorella protothecoides]|uniref:Uncharacterized protein n=1 Tax=Auxenochlorella protothecoides TaxID=3075 RepID=A0A087SFK5_AUXPR|nr:hypothetical protein F751_3227 [Auxenochlorella protothecoides]KFM24509.1 hypothetical protein F751_3227 [Auxenochlorella protothecoides]